MLALLCLWGSSTQAQRASYTLAVDYAPIAVVKDTSTRRVINHYSFVGIVEPLYSKDDICELHYTIHELISPTSNIITGVLDNSRQSVCHNIVVSARPRDVVNLDVLCITLDACN